MKDKILIYKISENKDSVVPLSELKAHLKRDKFMGERYIGMIYHPNGISELVINLRGERHLDDKFIVDSFLDSLRYNYVSEEAEK